MRLLLFLIVVTSLSCKNTNQTPGKLQGVWIPETIDWKDGSFKILSIRDSCFTQISATQSKDDKDSIHFMIEPGFNLSAGAIHIKDTVAVVSIRDLYKHIPRLGEKIPGSMRIGTLNVLDSKGFLVYQGKYYKKTNMFKRESQDIIDSISINFAKKLKPLATLSNPVSPPDF